MAGKKISQLTAATTPLGGTEELPIVQSGTTTKVSVNNLTDGKAVSALSVTATNIKTSPATANLDMSGSSIVASGTDTNIDINITPKGTGEVNLPKVDIDAGAIDGTAIGAGSASTGAFTTLLASSTVTLSGLTASTTLALNGSKEVISVTNTGTGNNVLATSPTLTTPNLGTPSTLTLTNATGLPVSTGISGLGTGVASALAINVGSAGAPVVNGGALGTPSSGTVTNLTGTASININGTVGASTPNTGAFTTLSTTGDVTISDKIVHSGDTNTAIRFPSNDTISLETAGLERARVTSAGELLVGNTVLVADEKFRVDGNFHLGGEVWLQNGSKAWTVSTSATEILELTARDGHYAAELTIIFDDTSYPNGTFLQKVYVATLGSGVNVSSVTVAQEDKVLRRTDNTTTSYFVWTAAVVSNKVRLSAAATQASGAGTIRVLATNVNFTWLI